MQTTSEIEIKAELVGIRHEHFTERILQVIITNQGRSPQEILLISVRQRDGTTTTLTEPHDKHNLLPLKIKPGEAKTITGLYHESVKKNGAVIVLEDNSHIEYTSPIRVDIPSNE